MNDDIATLRARLRAAEKDRDQYLTAILYLSDALVDVEMALDDPSLPLAWVRVVRRRLSEAYGQAGVRRSRVRR